MRVVGKAVGGNGGDGRVSAEFDIGAQVVCLKSGWDVSPAAGGRFPVKGDILTIREIIIDNAPEKHDSIFFRFVEISNPIRIEFTGEISFARIYFRPVRKTDISIFEKHLVPLAKVASPAERIDRIRAGLRELLDRVTE
jgi:hypothetical protein